MIHAVCLNPSIDTFVWVDDLVAGEVNRSRREQRFPGGKGVHVALAARELGERVSLLAFWGGPTGEWIRRACQDLGVNCMGPECQEWARTCTTFKSDSRMDETELLGCGPVISEAENAAMREALQVGLASASVVAISGSLPGGLAETTYAEMVGEAEGRGVPVYLDFTGEPLRAALEARPFGLHLNRREGAAITGAVEPIDIIGRLLESCRQVCLTDGASGLWLADGDSCVHARCPGVQAVSAVGSGDCCVAGLCVALCRALPLEEAARWAAACGAANCLRPELGMLHRDDVERLMESTEISQK